MGASRHIETFLEMMAVERGAARRTMEGYRRDLDDFAEYAQSRGCTIVAAATADIRGYVADMTSCSAIRSTA